VHQPGTGSKELTLNPTTNVAGVQPSGCNPTHHGNMLMSCGLISPCNVLCVLTEDCKSAESNQGKASCHRVFPVLYVTKGSSNRNDVGPTIWLGPGFLDMVEGWAIEGVFGAMSLLLTRSGICPINPLHLFFETPTTLQLKSALTPLASIQGKIVKDKKYKNVS